MCIRDRNNYIFAPRRRIPWSKIMKLTTLMLLDRIQLCLNFGKIRFINNGFIRQKILALKNLEKCFWPIEQNLTVSLVRTWFIQWLGSAENYGQRAIRETWLFRPYQYAPRGNKRVNCDHNAPAYVICPTKSIMPCGSHYIRFRVVRRRGDVTVNSGPPIRFVDLRYSPHLGG